MSDWRRIICDSRNRTADSLSSSDFYLDLPYPVNVPAGSQLFVDGVCLSISWPTIGYGRDKIYVQEEPVGATSHLRTVTLPHGTYNSATLASTVAIHLNAGTHLAGSYSTSVVHGILTISNSSDPTTQGKARIFSRSAADLAYLQGILPGYVGEDAMEVLGLWETPVLTDGTAYIYNGQSVTGTFLDLVGHKQAFIHSPGLGAESSTMTIGGATDVIRRVLLGGGVAGDVITDTLSTGLCATYFDADTILKRLHFQIKGFDGNTLHMSHHEISWELIIQRP
jgi:hypothetical protein